MKVIQYLKSHDNDFEQLKEKYGIKSNFHETDPLVILNYDQIESPKLAPIVQECRGLVLNSETLEVVARAFKRFFNHGEVRHYAKDFNWSTVEAQVKEDGSLILLYYFNGWRINTRNSFGMGDVNFSGKTWDGLFRSCVKTADMDKLDKSHTYVFELVGPYNKVVRRYMKTVAILLSCVRNSDGKEHSAQEREAVATLLGVEAVRVYPLNSIEDIQAFLSKSEKDDPTFEGFVIRDGAGRRWKIKSTTYVSLHHMHGNGNIHNPKYILPFILNSESDEVLSYFPECKPSHDKLKRFVDDSYAKLEKLWHKYKDEKDQKRFALAIVPQTKFNSVLFAARRYGKSLAELWREAGDLILKAYK